MTRGHTGWDVVVSTTVLEDGIVEAMGQQYWSPEMQRLAGWEVEVRVRDDGGPAQIWRGHNMLCGAEPISETGFVDGIVLRAISRKMGERVDAKRALVVSGQAALLDELLANAIEDGVFGSKRTAGFFLAQCFDRLVQFFGIPVKATIERQRHRDLERTKRREARLRLAQSIFDLPYTINHHKSSFDIQREQKTDRADAKSGHCLSGVAK